MTKIMLPISFERFTNNTRSLEVSGDTVEEALDVLTTHFALLQPVLFAEEKRVQRFVNIFVDNDNIKNLNGLQTTLTPHSVVSIVVAVAGG